DLALVVVVAGLDLRHRFQRLAGHTLDAVDGGLVRHAVAHAFLDVEDDCDVLPVGRVAQLAADLDVVVAERAVILEQLVDVGVDHGGVVLAAEDAPAEGAVRGVDERLEARGANEIAVADEADVADADLGAFGDLEDDLVVPRFAALDQRAGGEGAALL